MFTLDAESIRCDMIDRRARTADRLALVAGVLAGRPGAAGAGAHAMSRESETVALSGGFTAKFNPGSRQIDLAMAGGGSWLSARRLSRALRRCPRR